MFTYLSDTNFHNEVLRAMQPLLIAPGETLITQGHSAAEMYLISSGTLDVYYSAEIARSTEDYVQRRGESSIKSNTTKGSRSFDNKMDDLPCTGSVSPAISPHADGPKSSIGASNDAAADEIRITSVGSGEHIGEIALLGESMEVLAESGKGLRVATVRASAHCELFAIQAAAFNNLCQSYPDVKAAILDLAAKRSDQIRAAKTVSHYQSSAKAIVKFTTRLALKRESTISKGSHAFTTSASTGGERDATVASSKNTAGNPRFATMLRTVVQSTNSQVSPQSVQSASNTLIAAPTATATAVVEALRREFGDALSEMRSALAKLQEDVNQLKAPTPEVTSRV